MELFFSSMKKEELYQGNYKSDHDFSVRIKSIIMNVHATRRQTSMNRCFTRENYNNKIGHWGSEVNFLIFQEVNFEMF